MTQVFLTVFWTAHPQSMSLCLCLTCGTYELCVCHMPSPFHPHFEHASNETKCTTLKALHYEIFIVHLLIPCGPGSSVGIATVYGQDGPGIESRWDEIFHPFRSALGPPRPPVQWVPGLPRGYRGAGGGGAAVHSPPSSAEVLEE
jgi:hypothetical protein